MKNLLQTNVLSGLFFMLVGVGFLVPALQYGLGQASRMGPGYFPALLSIVLIGLGLTLAITGMTREQEDEPPITGFGLRAVVIVIGSILLFAFILQKAGLIASIFVLVVTSSLATRTAGKWQIWVFACTLAAFSAIIFVGLLGLPVPLWPRV